MQTDENRGLILNDDGIVDRTDVSSDFKFGQVFDFDQILSGGNIFVFFAIGLGDGAVVRCLRGGVRQIFLCDNKVALCLFELGFDVDDIRFGFFDIRLSVLVVDHGGFVFGLTGGAAVPELGETVKVKFCLFKVDFCAFQRDFCAFKFCAFDADFVFFDHDLIFQDLAVDFKQSRSFFDFVAL